MARTANSLFRYLGYVTIALLVTIAPNTPAASPDVTLKGLDGKDHRLSEYIGKGKWVVLNIWGPKCPPCVEEMPELQAFHDAHHDKTAIVVGMALDYPSFGYAKIDQVAKFVDENFITYPILLGDSEIVAKFGGNPLRGTPTSLVYNRKGELVAEQVGMVTQKIIEDFISRYEEKSERP